MLIKTLDNLINSHKLILKKITESGVTHIEKRVGY